MFAKIFESEKVGQILVKIDTNNDCDPEVRIYFEPDGFGVCSFAMTFNGGSLNEEAQWSAAEKFFSACKVDELESAITKTMETLAAS